MADAPIRLEALPGCSSVGCHAGPTDRVMMRHIQPDGVVIWIETGRYCREHLDEANERTEV